MNFSWEQNETYPIERARKKERMNIIRERESNYLKNQESSNQITSSFLRLVAKKSEERKK